MEINNKTIKKMERISKGVDGREVGGLLIGEVDKKGEVKVTDAIIVEQEVTYGTVNLTEEALMEYTKEASAKQLSKIIGWWHSHQSFGAFWSGTDETTSNRMARMMGGLCVSIVVSTRKPKILAKITTETKDGRLVNVDNVGIQTEREEIMEWAKGIVTGNKPSKREIAEINKKVKKREISYFPKQGNWYPRNYNANETIIDIYDEHGNDTTKPKVVCERCFGYGVLGDLSICQTCNGIGYVPHRERREEELEEERQIMWY